MNILKETQSELDQALPMVYKEGGKVDINHASYTILKGLAHTLIGTSPPAQCGQKCRNIFGHEGEGVVWNRTVYVFLINKKTMEFNLHLETEPVLTVTTLTTAMQIAALRKSASSAILRWRRTSSTVSQRRWISGRCVCRVCSSCKSVTLTRPKTLEYAISWWVKISRQTWTTVALISLRLAIHGLFALYRCSVSVVLIQKRLALVLVVWWERYTTMEKILKMHEAEYSWHSLFSGHGNSQPMGPLCEEHQSFWYHLYVILERTFKKKVVASVYDVSLVQEVGLPG